MLRFDVVKKRLLAIARFDYTDGGSDIGMKLSLDEFTKTSCMAGKNGLGGDSLCRGKHLEEVKIFVGQAVTFSPKVCHRAFDCISPADTRLFHLMVGYEDLVEPEQLEWYQKSPEERFLESQRLMAHYLGMGGSLAPDLDPESPFWSAEDLEGFAREMEEAQKRAGVVVRERN